MINGQRKVWQRCDICEAKALYCSGAIVLIGKDPERGLIVAQCPQCERFICSEHAQRGVCHLAPNAMEVFRELVQDTGFLPTVLCCPWHSMPLGQFRDWYIVLGNATHKASETSQHYARQYVEEPTRYLQRLSGFDLSQRRLALPEAIPWPLEESYQSNLFERIKAGQSVFEASAHHEQAEPPSHDFSPS